MIDHAYFIMRHPREYKWGHVLNVDKNHSIVDEDLFFDFEPDTMVHTHIQFHISKKLGYKTGNLY